MIDPLEILNGKTILLTRPAARGTGILQAAESWGAVVVHRPAIRFDPPQDGRPAGEAVDGLEAYDWILLTSPTGAGFFFGRLGAAGRSLPKGVRLAVVGPATAQAVRGAGRSPDLVAAGSDAEGLGSELLARTGGSGSFLWVKPEEARPGLERLFRDAGADLHPVSFYRTVPDPACPAIAADLAAGRYDAALFTSPSTYRAVVQALPEGGRESLRRVVLVAIGRTTSRAMAEDGRPPDGVSTRPESQAVAEALAAAFRSGPAPGTLC